MMFRIYLEYIIVDSRTCRPSKMERTPLLMVYPLLGKSLLHILPVCPCIRYWESPITLKGRIDLRNVNFAYPTRPGVQVCKGYSISIEPGEVVALVGPSGDITFLGQVPLTVARWSGTGKSTIMNLLLRFYDADSGEVLLDGEWSPIIIWNDTGFRQERERS